MNCSHCGTKLELRTKWVLGVDNEAEKDFEEYCPNCHEKHLKEKRMRDETAQEYSERLKAMTFEEKLEELNRVLKRKE